MSNRSLRPPLHPRSGAAAAIVLAAGLTLAVSAGCSSRRPVVGTENQPPVVELDPASWPKRGADGALHAVAWSGVDPDGLIGHYRVAINPLSLTDGDPAWVSTRERSQPVLARPRAGRGAIRGLGSDGRLNDGREFDLIAVQAVDDRGAVSQPAVRAFFEDNIAPSVQIVSPTPTAILNLPLPPAFTLRWKGIDPDGANGGPVSYKYLLLRQGFGFPYEVAVSNPDSLRRFYAPAFEGWTEVPGRVNEADLSGLAVGANYVFVITAFDEQGAYDPVFNLNKNMVRFRVTAPGAFLPRLTIWSTSIHYTQVAGSQTDPAIDVEVPAGSPVTLRWFGQLSAGRSSIEYRWVLDPKHLEKDRKRPRAGNDLHHWRPWSATLLEATIGPFADDGKTHVFVLEARDEFGAISRITVHLHPVGLVAEKDLLIVDDTRFLGDEIQAGTGCVRAPLGAWPTAAELDTFLFARGGYPWRCNPAGTISPPGLFAGYDFDTLGTRTGATDPTVPLSVLGRYRHVVWIVDAKSATFNGPGIDPLVSITSLRYMSGPGRFNSLAAYSEGGGAVWLIGGGAMATTGPWNGASNDGFGTTFSSSTGELAPGRFIYDLAHWRSEIQIATVSGFIQSLPGAPARLPLALRAKSVALDPLPPGRAPAQFYKNAFDVEFLSQPNFIVENGVPVLDSLYHLITFGLPPTAGRRVTMTSYRGSENGPFILSGFEVWSFTRADGQALVDFVLGDTWGLVKSSAPEALVRAVPRRE
jgi:hypothetical protein